MIAVGCGNAGTKVCATFSLIFLSQLTPLPPSLSPVQILTFSDLHRRWNIAYTIPCDHDEVTSVSWAPSVARFVPVISSRNEFALTPPPPPPPLHYFSPDRDYHTVAVSTKGAAIGTDAVVLYKVFVDERGLLVAEQVGRFLDHKDLVWKLEWNVAGTVLSSSGEDGKVRLWKGACPEYPLCRQGESLLTFFLFRKKIIIK